MAHTFGTVGTLQQNSAGDNPITGSFTINALDTVVGLVIIYNSAGARTGGAPTIGGVTMVDSGQGPVRSDTTPESTIEVWYTTSPPAAGSQNYSIPSNDNVGPSYVYPFSARAASGKVSAFDVSNKGGTVGTNPSISVTTTVNGDIIFAFLTSGATTWAPSARAGTVMFSTDEGAFGNDGQYFLQATAGAKAMTWTFGTSDDWGGIAIAFKEANPTPAVDALMFGHFA